jgi:Omp85 superfamily domain
MQGNAFFVGDNTINGLTSPLDGFRYRVGAEQYFGDFKFTAVTADLRKYWRLKPVTLAVRTYNYLRLGQGGENLFPLYAGYGYLIRGYEVNSFYNNNNQSQDNATIGIEQLSGSKLSVFNFEVRLPFTGPKKLAQIQSKFLFSDLNLFFDAGLAWTENTKVAFKSQPTYQTVPLTDVQGNPILDQSGNQIFTQFTNERVPAMSVGVSLRVNLFGALIIEPYYAIPFQRKDLAGRGIFGLNFAPGW